MFEIKQSSGDLDTIIVPMAIEKCEEHVPATVNQDTRVYYHDCSCFSKQKYILIETKQLDKQRKK